MIYVVKGNINMKTLRSIIYEYDTSDYLKNYTNFKTSEPITHNELRELLDEHGYSHRWDYPLDEFEHVYDEDLAVVIIVDTLGEKRFYEIQKGEIMEKQLERMLKVQAPHSNKAYYIHNSNLGMYGVCNGVMFMMSREPIVPLDEDTRELKSINKMMIMLIANWQEKFMKKGKMLIT